MQNLLRRALTAKFENFGPEVVSVTLECFKDSRLVPTVLHNLKLGVLYCAEEQARALHRHVSNIGPEEYILQLKMAIWRASQTETRVAKTDAAVDRLRKKMSGEIPKKRPAPPARNNEDIAALVREIDEVTTAEPFIPQPVAAPIVTPMASPVGVMRSHPDARHVPDYKPAPATPAVPSAGASTAARSVVQETEEPGTPPDERPFVEAPGYMGPDRRIGPGDRRQAADRRATLEPINKNRRYGGDRRKADGCRRNGKSGH